MITFIEDGHIYLNSKGKKIPSVSQLVDFACGGNAYGSVNPKILANKAEYGTKVHALLELCASGKTFDFHALNASELIAINEFKRLCSLFCVYPKNTEQLVTYKELYAGRYDLLTKDDYLVDYKTYATVDDEKLERFSWQLGFYYLALGLEQEKGYIMWLPKGKIGQVIEVKAKSWRECLDCLSQYLHPEKSLF